MVPNPKSASCFCTGFRNLQFVFASSCVTIFIGLPQAGSNTVTFSWFDYTIPVAVANCDTQFIARCPPRLGLGRFFGFPGRRAVTKFLAVYATRIGAC
jgi:hypothetical protein